MNVSCKAINDHGCPKTSLSHWRWSFHVSTNEDLSLIIKTAGISLTSKEEQLSATSLDDQGGTWVASPMNPNPSTKNQQKSRKVDRRRACYCPYPQDQTVNGKAKCKKRFCSMDLKPWSPQSLVNWISFLQVSFSLIISIKRRKTQGISNLALCNIGITFT